MSAPPVDPAEASGSGRTTSSFFDEIENATRRRRKRRLIAALGVVLVAAGAFGAFAWYENAHEIRRVGTSDIAACKLLSPAQAAARLGGSLTGEPSARTVALTTRDTPSRGGAPTYGSKTVPNEDTCQYARGITSVTVKVRPVGNGIPYDPDTAAVGPEGTKVTARRLPDVGDGGYERVVVDPSDSTPFGTVREVSANNAYWNVDVLGDASEAAVVGITRDLLSAPRLGSRPGSLPSDKQYYSD